jgi:hypothetical protein
MTLEERLRRYAEKGELVHLSLAFYDGEYHANLALASPPSGYAKAVDKDPVKALEDVFAAAPVKVRTPKAREPTREEVTAAVTDPDLLRDAEGQLGSLPSDWTTP